MLVDTQKVRTKASPSRLWTAWLATLCLLFQLAASASCISGASARDAGQTAFLTFPICHAMADGKADPSNKAPAGPAKSGCLVCSLHCHGMAAPPSPSDVYVPPRVFAAAVRFVPGREHSQAIFVAGTSARGPPQIV